MRARTKTHTWINRRRCNRTVGAAQVIPIFKIAFKNQVLKLEACKFACMSLGSRGQTSPHIFLKFNLMNVLCNFKNCFRETVYVEFITQQPGQMLLCKTLYSVNGLCSKI